MRATVFLCVLLLALTLIGADCNKPAPAPTPAAPALPELAAQSRDELTAYLNQRLAMNQPDRDADQAHLEKNRTAYFGCLEKNKGDSCRFMLCSPYAFYTADEYYLAGNYDEAFTYYTAAFDLIKEEIAETIERLNAWEKQYTGKQQAGEVDEQTTRHYQFRRATASQRLYRNYAEAARIMLRYAMVFDKQNKSEEAKNAHMMADNFLSTAADAYEQYVDARTKLAPLLDPANEKHKSFYIGTIRETDKMLEIPHL